MKKDNFAEYAKELEGMDRIELILDLLVDKKITKDQAVVLIANDKQIKDKDVKTNPIDWWSGSTLVNSPYYPTTTTTPYISSPVVPYSSGSVTFTST